jgi:hypothetical protein
MSCENQTSKGDSDSLEVKATVRPFDRSATGWLLGQAVHYLNSADEGAAFEYARVVEVLRRCSGDLLEAVNEIFLQVKGGDTSLRWNLLYVLGDVGDENAADFLAGTALNPLPESKDGEGCESARDMEMLVSSGAVHALHRVATRHPQATDQVLKVIAARPAQAILIEAVKVAGELGLREKVQELLPKDDHWILDIRQARHQELYAEPEREDGKERGFTPPKSGSLYTAPNVVCCNEKEN